MASVGLNIKIPKETLIDLRVLLGKQVVVKYNGGRIVEGELKSYDRALNLILNNAVEVKYDEENEEDR